MRLEYVSEGSPDCPLIRLCELDPAAVERLRDLVKGLATGARESVVVHELPGLDAIDGCKLTFRIGHDRGVCQNLSGAFECILSATWWDNMEGLLEPFCRSDSRGSQWLTNVGEIALLISHDGQS
jgi:hypothetical protein